MSENINVALHVAAQLKAGVVWVNCTNLFDAACGFGGYRESGYGREGGREGLIEYMETSWFKHAPKLPPANALAGAQVEERPDSSTPAIDRTVKLYIGGKQARPDSGYSMEVRSPDGRLLGEAPLGNRKYSQRRRGSAQGERVGEARRTIAPRFCTTARRIWPSDRVRSFIDLRRPSVKSKLQQKSNAVSNASFRMQHGPTSSMAPYTIRHSATSRSP